MPRRRARNPAISGMERFLFAEVKGNEAAVPIYHSTADEDISLEKDQQQKDVATLTLK